jgi:methanogenic corrinoid protein MtbC1
VVIPAIEQMMTAISENLDANLAQHFLTAQIASEVTEEMLPLFKETPQSAGRVVLGTAQGDMHCLGRRLMEGMDFRPLLQMIDTLDDTDA